MQAQSGTMNWQELFDQHAIQAHARRARALGPATFLIDRVADDLAERLSVVLRKFPRVADIATPTDAVRQRLANIGAIGTVVSASVEGRPGDPLRVVLDEELLPFGDETLDLVVSALSLQVVNDLPGTLIQIRRALKPDGLFLAAMLGGETLSELRESFFAAETEVEGGVSPHVIPFVEVREAGALLQRAGFALPVADVDRITVRYATPFALMHDLRRMAATNPLIERRRAPLRRATIVRMAEIYAERFSDADGRVRATFDVVWLSGWAPDASQQKPLAPGSARTRLADALGTTEVSAGDKAKQ
jgi:SAM-dependent methyltransferase